MTINLDAMTGVPLRDTKWKTTIEENVLDRYASYNSLFTLSTIPREQLLNPTTIIKSRLRDIIAKSAGIGQEGNYSPFNEKGQTSSSAAMMDTKAFDTLKTETIKSLKASSEILKRGHDIFFKSVTIEGQNSANEERKLISFNSLNMTLQEPFGVTLFEKLRAAAFNNGYRDYIDCPYLLKIEFRGFDNKGNPIEVITARHIPIKIISIEMTIDAGGTNYELQAMAWNEFAMTDKFLYTRGTGGSYTSSPKEKQLTGVDKRAQTLNGALKLLEENLNEQQKIELKYGLRDTDATLDQYIIDSAPGVGQFTEASGNSEFDESSPGPGSYKFTIRPNQSIGQIIQDIVLQTEEYRNIDKIVEKYWKDVAGAQELQGQITNKESAELMPDFMVPWFKIKTSIYNTEAFDRVTKMHSKIIHFQVIPYRIHILNFAVPGLSGSPSWNRKAIKAYKYIYTGENNQILDLKINYNMGFYQATLLDGSRKDAVTANEVKNLSLIEYARRYGNKNLDYPETMLPMRSYPTTQKNEDVSTEDRGSRTAVDGFMDYLTNPLADMVNVEMTIMGDPAFIGQENYLPIERKTTLTESGGGTVSEQVARRKGLYWDKQLGCFNYDQAEAFVTLDFRFPTDINEKKGVMDFQSTENVFFSGLYRVNKVTSNFDQGKFTQTLSLIRFDQQGNQINVAENINILTAAKNRTESFLSGVVQLTKEELNAKTQADNQLGANGA
jgi:hypothetical protein